MFRPGRLIVSILCFVVAFGLFLFILLQNMGTRGEVVVDEPTTVSHFGFVEIKKPVAETDTPVATPTVAFAQSAVMATNLDLKTEQVMDPVQQAIIEQKVAEVFGGVFEVVPEATLEPLPVVPVYDPELPEVPIFNTPVPPAPPVYDQEYLMSYTLDEMWDMAVATGMVNKLSSCNGPVPAPFVNWNMAYRASGLQTSDRTYTEIKMYASTISDIVSEGGASFPSTGVVQVSEETVKSKLIELYLFGSIDACLENGRPTVYGPGLHTFLEWLKNYIV